VAHPAPLRHAAVNDVQHQLAAEALHQARRGGGPLPGGAQHGDRLLRIEPVGQCVDVVPGDEARAGDVPGLPLGKLSHVEDLQLGIALDAVGKVVDRDALDALDRTLLLTPAGHAAV